MFLTKRYQQALARHQLDDFDKLWAKKVDWFEPPNEKRGGWSGVGQLVLEAEPEVLDIFVKKQKNFGRRTLLHPKLGEPTFRREFERLQYLQRKQIGVAKVVFYDERYDAGQTKAILVTETLKGFVPLDQVIAQCFSRNKWSVARRRMLIKKVAKLLRRFHDSGLQHRALFPKHIFVKNADTTPEVALIDLEKARFNLFLIRRAYFDLSKLDRHTPQLSHTERLYFLLQYFSHDKLNWLTKAFCKKLLTRSRRKKRG